MAAAQESGAPLDRVLERYTEAYGGSRALAALSSISFDGTQTQEGKTFGLHVYKKRPNSIRYRLSRGTVSVICGYNGTEGWQRVDAGGDITVTTLSGASLDALRDEATFENPLFRYLDRRSHGLSLIGSGRIGPTKVDVVEANAPGQPRRRYYLDAGSGRLLQRDSYNEAGEVELSTEYSDYRQVGPYWFAFKIENRFNGETVASTQFNSIEINPGILSFYFEKPVEK